MSIIETDINRRQFWLGRSAKNFGITVFAIEANSSLLRPTLAAYLLISAKLENGEL